MTFANKIVFLCAILLLSIARADAQQPVTTIAVIGDFGKAGEHEQAVSELTHSFHPDAVITVGDNNYEFGAEETIDKNIGQYYADYIYPYHGKYGKGASVNKFFPSLGNHDWVASGAKPYFNYFTLPGNERYYDVVIGNVHLYALDSDPHEPDGMDMSSTQALWLKEQLQEEKTRWKIVYFHHPPYCSGAEHGSDPTMQWPFKEWGADLILTGHEHVYERLNAKGLTYIVNGIGGKSLYKFKNPIVQSIFRYNENYGSLKIESFQDSLVGTAINIEKKQIDRFAIKR